MLAIFADLLNFSGMFSWTLVFGLVDFGLDVELFERYWAASVLRLAHYVIDFKSANVSISWTFIIKPLCRVYVVRVLRLTNLCLC